VLNRVEHGGERIIVEQHGKAVVAIVTVDDLKRLEDLEDAIASKQLQQAVEQNNGFTTLEAIIRRREINQ
jgi:prevent-host-death family protein